MKAKRIVEWWIVLEAGSEPVTVIANQDNIAAVLSEMRHAFKFLMEEHKALRALPTAEGSN